MKLPHPYELRWQATGPGAPLVLQNVARSAPEAGEVRLRVSAVGLNFADTLILNGRYQEKPPTPLVPGMEVSGTVEEVGPGVAHPRIGSRVAVFPGSGGLSETLCVAAGACLELPDAIDDVSAAAFQIVYGTAHLALTRRARLEPGERLVVSGAAGGTGLATVQIGSLLGAEVIAIARGADKRALCAARGADHTIDAESDDIRGQIRALGGADVVVDTVGSPMWEALFGATNPEGRLFPIGFAGGSVPQIKSNHLLVKNLSVLGFYWGGYACFAPEALKNSLSQLLRWMEEGTLIPEVGALYPFDQADAALEAIRRREARGKLVVVMPRGSG